MNEVSPQDRAAARKVLGIITMPPHPRMYYTDAKGDTGLLPGADSCLHALTGGGTLVATESPVVAAAWAKTPYRHHQYVRGVDLPGGHPYCLCGNGEHHAIHEPCWWSEWKAIDIEAIVRQWQPQPCDDCGRRDGTHDNTIEH